MGKNNLLDYLPNHKSCKWYHHIHISNLQNSIQRAITWKKWIEDNKNKFNLSSSLICTSREDRNLLAVLLEINKEIILDEKIIVREITPMLDQLHIDELL